MKIYFLSSGSGKSTLAKYTFLHLNFESISLLFRSLNNGYHGQIFSTDDYFKDMNTNEYFFDLSKLDDAHLYNRRLGLLRLLKNKTQLVNFI
jgi:hypothetical protein